MKITGDTVNHEAEDKDNIIDESVMNNNAEAFEEAPGTTLHPLVNENLKDDFMSNTNDLQDKDDSSDQSKIDETLMGTKVETQENVNPPVAGNESVPEGGKIRPDKHKRSS